MKPTQVTIAAAGDVHAGEENAEAVASAFAEVAGEADAILLAGDLTTGGERREAEVLAEACERLSVPVVAVLGNHDWHANRPAEVTLALTEAGVIVLDRAWTVLDLAGVSVGIAGTKGFVGGFPDSTLPDFGEPVLRAVYAETTAEVDALDTGLRSIADCDLRVALLHYAPTTSTLEGEPQGIWAFLGSDRLAEPIRDHRPDLVLHGHGHAGTFQGFIAAVPVYNVSIPVMGADFSLFELEPHRTESDVSSAHPAGEKG